MFKPTSAKDRLNYGKVLMPPVGYKLERAVGTTYSLDMVTLTALAIALGLVEDTDSVLIGNPISLLSAFHKVADRITVFCEAGQIRLPLKPNELCLTLEKMIVSVVLPYNERIKGFPAFHPKTWLLEYSNGYDEKKYRFVVMSRNMTFDHSWDVACSLDGEISAQGKVDSSRLSSFLSFLRDNLNEGLNDYNRQKDDLDYFIQMIPKVGFHIEEGFDNCDILPMGIGAGSYNMLSDRLISESHNELVVMSPFLSESIIKDFNDKIRSSSRPSSILITRRTELSKLKDGSASSFDIYVMKDEVIDGESAISDGEDQDHNSAITDENLVDEDYRKQDIHAKIYIMSDDKMTDLYVGSMNASYAALNVNVEMMLRLETNRTVFDTEDFLDDIMGDDREGKKNPFELVYPETIPDEKDSSDIDDEKLIKKICRISMSATVVEKNNGYCIRITADVRDLMAGAYIRPLRGKKECELTHFMEFEALKLLDLSEFYVVSVKSSNLERVIMIPTFGIPEKRNTEIIKSVIRNRNQFIEYVSFILGDDYVQSFLENKKISSYYDESEGFGLMPAVYEKMLKSSVTDPNKIAEIQYVTSAIEEEDIIPQDFRKMYDVFCETLGIKND